MAIDISKLPDQFIHIPQHANLTEAQVEEVMKVKWYMVNGEYIFIHTSQIPKTKPALTLSNFWKPDYGFKDVIECPGEKRYKDGEFFTEVT